MSGEQIKPGYKRTEVGVIPEDWEVKKFGEFASPRRERIDPRKSAPIRFCIELEHIDQSSGRLLGSTQAGKEASLKTAFQKNDVLFGKLRAYLRKHWLADRSGACSTEIWALHANQGLATPGYLYQSVSADTFIEAASYSYGTHMPRSDWNVVKDTEFPLPPLSEQRAIATALSDIDALLTKLDQLITKKRDLKQATMQQLLTGETRLPGFSGEWEVKRLGDVAVLNRHNLVPASQPDQHFVHFSLPAFDDGKCAPVELGSAIGSNKFQVPPDAVLVSKLNPRIPRIWAPATIPSNSCASTEWLVLTPKEGCSRSFLFVLCSAPYFCEQMELQATGTTGSHQRISPSTALRLEVSVPVDREEQTAIATVLADMDAEIAVLETRRDKTRALKQGMTQELLTGRIRLV